MPLAKGIIFFCDYKKLICKLDSQFKTCYNIYIHRSKYATTKNRQLF